MTHGTFGEAYFLPNIQFLIQHKQKQKGTSTNIHIKNQHTYKCWEHFWGTNRIFENWINPILMNK